MFSMNLKLPTNPGIGLYLVFGSMAYGLGFAMQILALVLPEKYLEASLLLVDIQFGYLMFLAYLGPFVPPIFYSLIVCLALYSARAWCLVILFGHYGLGLWKFFNHDPTLSFKELFAVEAIAYFIEFHAFMLLIFPFIFLNTLILTLLIWPRQEVPLLQD